MVYYILIALSLFSLAGLAVVLGWQARENRRRQINYRELGNYRVSGLLVDYLAFKIVRFFRGLVIKSYVFSMHFIKNLISTARYLIVKIERRFNRLAANLTKPDEIHTTDKVSFFLREIKDHKETMMAEMKNSSSNNKEIEN